MIKEEIRIGIIENIDEFVNIINFELFQPLVANLDQYTDAEDRIWCKAIYNGNLIAILALTPSRYVDRSVNIDLIQMNAKFVNKYVDREIIDELKCMLAERNYKLTATIASAINIPLKIYEQLGFVAGSEDYMIA